jgi:hypothetical protein
MPCSTQTISQSRISTINLKPVIGNDFDGFYIRHIMAGGESIDYSEAEVSASIWDTESEQKVTDFEIEVYSNSGWVIHPFLPASKTALLEAEEDMGYCNAPARYQWSMPTRVPTNLSLTVSATAGTFITNAPHGLSVDSEILFRETTVPSINTGIYNIDAILSPTRFRVDSLSGITAATLGGFLKVIKNHILVQGDVSPIFIRR